jgi:hypothetical protein
LVSALRVDQGCLPGRGPAGEVAAATGSVVLLMLGTSATSGARFVRCRVCRP